MNYIHHLLVVIWNEKDRLDFEKFEKDLVLAEVEQVFEPGDGQRTFEKYDGREDGLKMLVVPEWYENLPIHIINSSVRFYNRSKSSRWRQSIPYILRKRGSEDERPVDNSNDLTEFRR